MHTPNHQHFTKADYLRYCFFVGLLLLTAWLKATPPNNDLPAGATNLFYAEFCEAPVIGTLSEASSTGPAALACNNFLPTDPPDVWYAFNAPTDISTISIDPGLSDLFPAFEIYAFDDLSMPIGCSVSSGPGAEYTTGGLTPYQSYYIRVFDAATLPNPDGNLSFSICLHGLPTLEAFFPFGTDCITEDDHQLFNGFGIWKHLVFNNDGPGVGISVFDSEPLDFTNMGIYSNINNPPVESPYGPLMDRFFGLSVAEQPTGPIRIRLYFNDAEWQRFADNFTEVVLENYLLHNFSGLGCTTEYPTNETPDYVLPTQLGQIASNLWYIEYEIDHFSAFFVGPGPAALPVIYHNIAGQALPNGNLLEWTTAQERNAATFFVDKLQKTSWVTVGSLAAAGNSQQLKTYQFVDRGGIALETMYRLRQQDFDGSQHISQIIRIQRKSNQPAIIIFPNPVLDQLTVQSAQPIQKASIINQGGKIIQLGVSSSGRIATSALPSGVYQLQLITQAGLVSYHRFIKY